MYVGIVLVSNSGYTLDNFFYLDIGARTVLGNVAYTVNAEL